MALDTITAQTFQRMSCHRLYCYCCYCCYYWHSSVISHYCYLMKMIQI